MTKGKWAMGILAIGVLGGGAVYLTPVMQESNIEKATTINANKFDGMEELAIEIMDTASFTDKNLEKWFNDNKEVEGEHIYYDNTHTYTLVIGKIKSSETIWLDGVRVIGKTLVVGYEMKDGAEYGIEKEANITPVLMLRTEGEFKNVAGVAIEQKEKKPKEPKITDTVFEGEVVNPDEENVEKEVEMEKEEDVVEKEVEKKVEKKKEVVKEVEKKKDKEVVKDKEGKEKESDKND